MILLTFRGAVILSLLLFLYYGHDPVLGYGDCCRWRKTTSCLLIRQIHLIWFDALDCESQRGQRDDSCFFSPELLPPHTRPSTYIIPSITGGAFVLLFGWRLVVISGRQPSYFPHQRNQSKHRKCTALFSHPKNIGIASLLQLV